MYSKKIIIRYGADVVDKPVVYSLVKDFDLAFNIMRARISPRREGLMVLDLSGTKKNFDRAIRYLRGLGLSVEPLSKSVTRNIDRCVHCGACVAFCTSGALYLDKNTMEVIFDPEKCSGCELCVKGCPTRAMTIDLL
ncbi:MAG: NIL domain-containing protein [Syntrophaceae bacterium]|nr:NIL domain-containing protein [Syntrophaceae bacterium]